MIAVAVAFSVRVVLIDEKLPLLFGPVGELTTEIENTLAGFLKHHDLPGIGALRRGVLRMGPVHVQAAAIGQEFVEKFVVLRTRPLALAFYFKSSKVQERILIFVVP